MTDVRAAARHLLALRKAQDSFEGFVRLLHPDWDIPDFHLDLIRKLDLFEKDALGVNNLLVTMPPRHAKSTYSTVLFPSYFMARDPRRFVMSCSYNAELATGFGREVRETVENLLISQAFPDFILSPKFTAADSWRTESGGLYNAVGIGGTTSGRPANLLIVDDPIKAREEAESMTQRNKTWSYYTSALATRLQPTHDNRPAKQLIILTRWHPDDIGGRLQETDDWAEGLWEHVNYPAIRTETKRTTVLRTALPPDHPLFLDTAKPEDKAKIAQIKSRLARRPPKPGEETLEATLAEKVEHALWPARFPLADLKRRERLNPHDFASLYQQEPFIRGGNLIKSSWWRTYPSDLNPTHLQTLIIAVDTAFKAKESADFSVALTAGMDAQGDLYVIDVMRARLDYPELKTRLIQLNNRWRGRGLRGLYIEDKASGQSIIQDLKRGTGMAVIPYPVRGDKVTRVHSVLPLIEGGRVFLPESAPWLDEFIEECVTFPSSRHDDQVDALAMALDVLSRTALSPEVLSLHVDVGQSLNALAGASGSGSASGFASASGGSAPGNPYDPSAIEAAFPRDGTVRRADPMASAFGKSLTSALKQSKWGGWGM
jgi:predicted phage terminase large subunit-like protein